jgi:hypothetical protein
MDTSLDSIFIERSESIVAELGFKNLKSFVKNQALLILMSKMEKFKAEDKRFKCKYGLDFNKFQERIEQRKDEEIFSEEDDYLDWRFAKEF